MCPYYKVSTNQCKVVPYESDAYRDNDCKNYYCMHHENYRRCANLAAKERGDYKVERD